MTDRYEPIRAIARDLHVDAVALVPGANFTRLMGHAFLSFERPLVLVIPAEGAPAAIVPNIELASWADVGFEGETFDWRDQDGHAGAFAALAGAMPLDSIAVEGQVMRVFVHHALTRAFPDLRVIDAEREISALRLCKRPDEVAALREAISVSEAALSEVLDEIRTGQTEKQIERRLVQAMFAHGAESIAFTPLVAAGANSAQVHAMARETYGIRPGDALLFDFGASCGGFTADITRTVFVEHASDEAADVYATVLAANARGHAITRPGITAHEIDDAVTGVLEASPYAGFIRTKTGHGLGREVHEAPYIMRGNRQVLSAGTVFTNEPGLYLDGKFGVRIEDDMLVTEQGGLSLTTLPRGLTVVGQPRTRAAT